MPELFLSKQAKKFLKRLIPKHRRQIAEKIKSLLENPFPANSKFLIGHSDYLRVRVGEYRIIYLSSPDLLRIYIIGRRNDDEVYRKFRRLL